MRKDFFYSLNECMWQLPEAVHILTFALMATLYAQLVYGAYIEHKKLKPHARLYMIIRCVFLLMYLFIKATDETFGMFDLFLPVYIIGYIDGLIILKGYTFHRCENIKQAFKKIMNFNSVKPKDNERTKSN